MNKEGILGDIKEVLWILVKGQGFFFNAYLLEIHTQVFSDEMV